jgi:hypothetical protein
LIATTLQEFYRLAALRGLVVRLLPQELHDSTYNTEDIEVWVVSRLGSAPDLPTYFAFHCNSQLTFHSWGDTELVAGSMLSATSASTVDIVIKQIPSGTTGCYIWPGSVILSRYVFCEILHTNFQAIC